MNKKLQLFLIGIGVAAAGMITFFLVRGTIKQVKGRAERGRFNFIRSKPDSIK